MKKCYQSGFLLLIFFNNIFMDYVDDIIDYITLINNTLKQYNAQRNRCKMLDFYEITGF